MISFPHRKLNGLIIRSIILITVWKTTYPLFTSHNHYFIKKRHVGPLTHMTCNKVIYNTRVHYWVSKFLSQLFHVNYMSNRIIQGKFTGCQWVCIILLPPSQNRKYISSTIIIELHHIIFAFLFSPYVIISSK